VTRRVGLLDAGRVAALSALSLTYGPPGGFAGTSRPGFSVLSRSLVMGDASLDDCAEVLLGWGVQTGAGLGVLASAARVGPGVVAELRIGVGPLGWRAPLRVVEVYDEPGRRGFAYGTLPGHPEDGEESFVLSVQPDGRVLFTVTATSRPASRAARLGGPVTRLVQHWMAGRYLRACLRAVR
jgi:uncharacterized protein (UPF0548 family)